MLMGWQRRPVVMLIAVMISALTGFGSLQAATWDDIPHDLMGNYGPIGVSLDQAFFGIQDAVKIECNQTSAEGKVSCTGYYKMGIALFGAEGYPDNLSKITLYFQRLDSKTYRDPEGEFRRCRYFLDQLIDNVFKDAAKRKHWAGQTLKALEAQGKGYDQYIDNDTRLLIEYRQGGKFFVTINHFNAAKEAQHKIPYDLINKEIPIGVTVKQAATGFIKQAFDLEGDPSKPGYFNGLGGAYNDLATVELGGNDGKLHLFQYVLNKSDSPNLGKARELLIGAIKQILPKWEGAAEWALATMDKMQAQGGGYEQQIKDGVRMIAEYRSYDKQYVVSIVHE